MEKILRDERIVIGHVGDGNKGDEQVMGRFGIQDSNEEGQMVEDFAKRMEMTVVNTFFQKRRMRKMEE